MDVALSIYDSLLEGLYRLDRAQLGRLADVLGVTVHDLFHARGSDATDGDATRKVRPVPSKIRVSSPTSSTRENTAKKARKQRSTMPKEQPYEADAAADLLAKKFKVSRA